MPEPDLGISGIEPNKGLSFKDLLRLSLRTFRVKPVRAVLTVLGMAVGVGTVMFLVSLGYGLQYILIGKLVTTEDSLITMQVSYPSETELHFTTDTLTKLKEMAGVAEVSPVAEFSGEVQAATSSSLLITTRIVEPDYFKLTGSLPNLGTDLAKNPDGLILSAQTLNPINLTADASSLGKELGLKVLYDDSSTGTTTEAGTTKPLLPIVGILTDQAVPPLVIILGSSLSQSPPFYTQALIKATDANTIEKVRDQLLREGFLVSARIDLVNQAKGIMNIITIVLGVFGIAALLVSAIGMFNTMLVGFMERTYEVGILKSLGATDNDVRNLFLMEAFMMGMLGGASGITFGYGTGMFFNLVISTLAVHLGGKAFTLFITPGWFILLTLGLSAVIGLLSGFWPARRASQLSPKEAFERR